MVEEHVGELLETIGNVTEAAGVERGEFEPVDFKDGSFGWHLQSANGEVVAQGEGYTRREDRDEAMAMVKRTAALARLPEPVEG